jgi:spore germination cell wall hydrolase CwlJ-like protein
MPDSIGDDADEYECMVANIWHEARGEGITGMYAVALVTMNRVARRNKSICEVVYQPHQFSWTDDVTYNMLDNIDTVRSAAAVVMTDSIDDFTNGATHYHADYVKPSWASKMQHVTTIGKHIFYKAH